MSNKHGISDDQLNELSNALMTRTSSELTELIVGLMGGGGSDADMWKDHAVAMMGAVIRALVWKRDNQGLLLDIEVLRDSILLENIQKMAKSDDLPPDVIISLNECLQSILGCSVEKEDQEASALEQHGFLMMQFPSIFKHFIITA